MNQENKLELANLQKRIAKAIGEARDKAGLTQADAANHLGITFQAISNWERGYSKIDSASLLKLLVFYQTDIYDFMQECGYDLMRPKDGSDIWMSIEEREVAGAYSTLSSPEARNVIRRALGLVLLPDEKDDLKTG